MKKIIFMLFLFLFTSFLLSGCANNKKDLTQNFNLNSDQRRPDFGQPDRPADLRGFVKSVSGNEITIYKMDRQENGGFAGENGRERPVGENRESAAPVFGQNGAGTVMPGGGGPGMGMRGGMANGGDMDSSAILERMKQMSSGEEKIIVPVGIQMLINNESGGVDMTEAVLSDIKANQMLQFWLEEEIDDRKIANFVLIMR